MTVDRLVDELWDRPPATAANGVQVYISRLRKALPSRGNGVGVLGTSGSGYMLRVEEGALDAETFEQSVEQGQAALKRGDSGEASALLGQALALWRGAPL